MQAKEERIMPPETVVLNRAQVSRLEQVVAITTPVPDSLGRTSKRTPVFHLPVYEVKLLVEHLGQGTNRTEKLAEDKQQQQQQKAHEEPEFDETRFSCDLADLSDLIDKLKSYQNQWRRFGRQA